MFHDNKMNDHPGVFTNQKWEKGQGPSFTSENPATGEIIWKGCSASEEDVNRAVQNAKKAFKGWSSLTLDERSQYLDQFGETLQNNYLALAETISMETGKPLWESRQEVISMINKIKISLEAYGRRCSGIIQDQPHARSITRHRAHGVIAILGPFNFPGHLPNGHIVPALLAGNTVVFKPSEYTPLVAEQMIKYWEMSGLPPGVINLVQGGPDTGKALIFHPDVNGIFFTGSFKIGKWISDALSHQPQKILALELGGNNPLIIGQISDLKTASYLTLQSAYLTTGQRCTCARRLIIPDGELCNKFIHTLTEMIDSISIGPYTDIPEPYMGPLISEQQVHYLLKIQSNLAASGGIHLKKMRHLTDLGPAFISPGLIDVTDIAHIPDEEFFGPFLQVIRVKNFDEAIQEANRTKYGLAAGLLSESKEEYAQFYKEIEAGIINWNTQLTGASSAAPFGGIKCSGNFRPSGYYAADYCSYPVASMESPRLQLPPNLTPGIYL